jgi:hypothetical protein
MPVMAEVDCDDDTVTRVVTLPEEIRDDRGHFCVYDEKFIRRHDGDQPQIHAHCVAGPRCEYDHLRAGPPVNWPKSSAREEALTSPRPTRSTLRPPLRRAQTLTAGRRAPGSRRAGRGAAAEPGAAEPQTLNAGTAVRPRAAACA